MQDSNNIPLFRTWKGWYLAVLIIHFSLIALFYLITNIYNLPS